MMFGPQTTDNNAKVILDAWKFSSVSEVTENFLSSENSQTNPQINYFQRKSFNNFRGNSFSNRANHTDLLILHKTISNETVTTEMGIELISEKATETLADKYTECLVRVLVTLSFWLKKFLSSINSKWLILIFLYLLIYYQDDWKLVFRPNVLPISNTYSKNAFILPLRCKVIRKVDLRSKNKELFVRNQETSPGNPRLQNRMSEIHIRHYCQKNSNSSQLLGYDDSVRECLKHWKTPEIIMKIVKERLFAGGAFTYCKYYSR